MDRIDETPAAHNKTIFVLLADFPFHGHILLGPCGQDGQQRNHQKKKSKTHIEPADFFGVYSTALH